MKFELTSEGIAVGRLVSIGWLDIHVNKKRPFGSDTEEPVACLRELKQAGAIWTALAIVGTG